MGTKRCARYNPGGLTRGQKRFLPPWVAAGFAVLVLACGSVTDDIPSGSAGPETDITPSPKADPPAQTGRMPDFAHIALFVFENKEFGTVIGNRDMPNFNRYAREYALLTAEYAVAHPSLPNYLALLGGDTFGVASDCTGCYVDAAILPDGIERSGRSWRAYQEDMPQPCFAGDTWTYKQKHNPFAYFDSIRKDKARCEAGVVPLDRLEADIAAGRLPDFLFVTPNICNDAHDCPMATADEWIGRWVPIVQQAFEAAGGPYLIVLTWDEGTSDLSVSGKSVKGGGRVATVLVSPQVKGGFEDDTPYSHYSILKTIETAWGLPHLGHAAGAGTALIAAPWRQR